MYNIIFVSAFLYGSEIWTIDKASRERSQSAKMQFLRSVAGNQESSERETPNYGRSPYEKVARENGRF